VLFRFCSASGIHKSGLIIRAAPTFLFVRCGLAAASVQTSVAAPTSFRSARF
jgi:hypothetical protein